MENNRMENNNVEINKNMENNKIALNCFGIPREIHVVDMTTVQKVMLDMQFIRSHISSKLMNVLTNTMAKTLNSKQNFLNILIGVNIKY